MKIWLAYNDMPVLSGGLEIKGYFKKKKKCRRFVDKLKSDEPHGYQYLEVKKVTVK